MNTFAFKSFVKPTRFIAAFAGIVVLTSAVSGCSSSGRGSGPQAFKSPEGAVDSLIGAVRSGSPDRIKSVLGAEADELVESGDKIQDRNRSAKFLSLYEQHHELVPADDGSMSLCIGAGDWPFPIPLVKDEKPGVWKFDTSRGKDEILNRRVGNNELSAIQVCLAIVDAERDYASRTASGAACPEYAARFISEGGKTNGLYWETKPTDPPSPLGVLVAAAAEEGYTFSRHAPYHGYYYRLLTAQGPRADGGAYDYRVNGKLIGGFAVIARPAQYGSSGVMTFIVNHDGVVYQTDLGPKTDELAKAIKTFDPGPEWKKAQ